MKTTLATTDEYLAALVPDEKEVLEKLRMTIRAAVPSAQESISTGIPTFKHGRRYLVSIGAAKQHVALYVMRGSALEALENDLEAYDTSNTVIRFAPNKPLPTSLVRSIVEIRLGEIETQTTHSTPVADRSGREQGAFLPGWLPLWVAGFTASLGGYVPRRMTEQERQEFLAESHLGVLSIAKDDDRSPLTVPLWYGYEPRGDISFFIGTQTTDATPNGRHGLLEGQEHVAPWRYSCRCWRNTLPAEAAPDYGKRTEPIIRTREVLCEDSSGGGVRVHQQASKAPFTGDR